MSECSEHLNAKLKTALGDYSIGSLKWAIRFDCYGWVRSPGSGVQVFFSEQAVRSMRQGVWLRGGTEMLGQVRRASGLFGSFESVTQSRKSMLCSA